MQGQIAASIHLPEPIQKSNFEKLVPFLKEIRALIVEGDGTGRGRLAQSGFQAEPTTWGDAAHIAGSQADSESAQSRKATKSIEARRNGGGTATAATISTSQLCYPRKNELAPVLGWSITRLSKGSADLRALNSPLKRLHKAKALAASLVTGSPLTRSYRVYARATSLVFG